MNESGVNVTQHVKDIMIIILVVQ